MSLSPGSSLLRLGVALARSRPLALCVAAVACVLAPACGDAQGELRVELCADVQIPQQLDAVRVTILDAQRAQVRAGVRELITCPGASALPLPTTITFSAPPGEELWIVAQGLSQGVERARFERRYRASQQAGQVVRLGLTQRCLGVSCPLGQTCVAGACELAPFEDVSALCQAPLAAMPDMGQPGADDMGADDMGADLDALYCRGPRGADEGVMP